MRLEHLEKYGARITFQQFAKIKTRAGGYKPDWIDVKTVWAKDEVISSAEIPWADEVLATVTYRFTVMASVTGLTPQMRILWKEKTYEIKDIAPDTEDGNVQVITALRKDWDES